LEAHVALLAVSFMLVSCLVSSSPLKVEATYPSETLVGFQWTAQHYAWERVELKLNTSGNDPSMHPPNSKTVEYELNF
jgi:hypothetical protein